MTHNDKSKDRLSKLKAEERARMRRGDALRNLAESRSGSLDNLSLIHI